MLVLASNSPRRKQLLSIGGWTFTIQAAEIDEQVRAGEPPDGYVLRLAEGKAQAVREILDPGLAAEAVIVAADTSVVDGQEILGKPANAAQAEAMLRHLRGRTHQVYTGLAVYQASSGRMLQDVCVTSVQMRDYSADEILAYIATGDPFDKAGAYAIQHPFFHPVESLHGCYPNVMGLPLCHLNRLLARFDLFPASQITAACIPAGDSPCAVYLTAIQGDS